MPKIYILLPVHNRCELTRKFITCLKSQTFTNFHLLLIDDGCSDGTVQMAMECLSSLTVISGTGQWWWAGALQQGYDWLMSQNLELSSDLVLIINDDTEFEADFLQNAVDLMHWRDRTMLLAWCYCGASRKLLDAGVHVDWSKLTFAQATSADAINCLSTNGLCMRLADFLATGGFRPALLPHYASDYEFTIRAHRRGMKLVTDPAWHLRLDQSASGYHELYVGSFFESLRKIFSKKSTHNPFMLTAFVLLSSPWKYKTINLYRIWLSFFLELCQLVKLRLVTSKQ